MELPERKCFLSEENCVGCKKNAGGGGEVELLLEKTPLQALPAHLVALPATQVIKLNFYNMCYI